MVKKPDLIGSSRLECVLISSVGLEFYNMCSLNRHGIIDASPMLKAFEDYCISSPTSSHPALVEGDVTSLAIGVALLNAINKVIENCPKNMRVFPWDVICPDLFLRPNLVETCNPSPKIAFEEAYNKFSTLLVERDALGYVTEVAKSDDFHRFPSKYVKAKAPPRAAVTSKSQFNLRTHLRDEDAAVALSGGSRKFVPTVHGADDLQAKERPSKMSRL